MPEWIEVLLVSPQGLPLGLALLAAFLLWRATVILWDRLIKTQDRVIELTERAVGREQATTEAMRELARQFDRVMDARR